MELFRLLVKRCPLEPLTSDEAYHQACVLQAELLGYELAPLPSLYLEALTLFIHAYEAGIR